MNSKTRITAMVAIVTMVAAGAFVALGNGGDSTETVSIQGSTTVSPYMLKVQERYEQENNVRLLITTNGSGTGAAAAINGNADLAMLSRDLKSSEKDAGLVQTVIGLDGIMAIVNKDCGVTDLTLKQLEGLFSGTYTNWNQVGGNDRPVTVVCREEGSGTRDGFEEALKKVDPAYSITTTAIVQTSTNSVIGTVDKTTGSIGYVSIGYADNVGSGSAAVSVDGVAATEENVLNGTYGIQRNLVLATMGEAQGAVKDLIDWILGTDGQKLLEECGFIEKV